MHPDVYTALMNYFDAGILTAGNGETVRRPGHVIVGAANAGAERLHRHMSERQIKDVLAEAFTDRYGNKRPELVRRFEAIPMLALEKEAFVEVLRTSSGLLAVRNNVTGVTTNSTTAITTGVWHQLEIHARVNGAGGASDAWLDGVAVPALSLAQNFGSTGIGRVELGNNTASRVYSALLDDVACSISFIP